jgi:4-hydroxy-tetrahydrodipicolinate synthase
MALPYRRNEVKERSRAEWRGACNVTLPSFTADFAGLNEAAIRHDVRRGAELGFWGTLVASESGTTTDEYCRFMEIAAEAAPPGFKLVHHASFSTLDEMLTTARKAEELGFEATLMSYPPTFRPKSAREVVDYTRAYMERTNLATILFAVMTWGFKSLHPSGFPPDALEELARLETAAAVKYEANPPGMPAGLADTLRRCGPHVLVECPLEQYAPALVEWFGMQWMGTSAYDSFGDRVPRMLRLLQEGKWDEGMQVYWSYQAARDAKSQFHASFAGANLIHRVGWKYMSWLHGFNGGLLRMPQMRLNPNQMRQLRQGMHASGFPDLPPDDDGFYTGRIPAT